MEKLAGFLAATLIVAGTLTLLVYAWGDKHDTVVCYAALDEEFSRPILKKFTSRTGIEVDMVFDSESSKTIGLVNRIMAEKGRPGCDVFWNNEVVNTIRLGKLNLLASYQSPAAAAFPQAFLSTQQIWSGFAARARVLIVNTEQIKSEDIPGDMDEILNLLRKRPELKGRIGMAKPLFGSTATWIAVLKTAKDQRPLQALVTLQKEYGLRILSGNKQCATTVASGELAMAFTDTDDAIIEKENGKPVEIVYLDTGGVLFFPNTLSIVKDCPHPGNARKLIDFLLSKEVEIMLAESSSAQIPVNPEIIPGKDFTPRVKTPREAAPMQVDWQAVADNWKPAMEWAKQVFGK